MSAFSSLSALWQTVIPLTLFVEAALELGLFLYQILCGKRPLRSFPCAVHFIILLTLLFSVTQGDPDEGKDAFLIGEPWIIFFIVIILAAFHFAIALPREYRRRKNNLSPFSIKEAIDKLFMGICFADPEGRIILCNDCMRRLSFALCGHELQITDDFETALEKDWTELLDSPKMLRKIRKLPAGYIEIIEMLYFEKLKQREIAELYYEGDMPWKGENE